jgi:hypothetical protein
LYPPVQQASQVPTEIKSTIEFSEEKLGFILNCVSAPGKLLKVTQPDDMDGVEGWNGLLTENLNFPNLILMLILTVQSGHILTIIYFKNF